MPNKRFKKPAVPPSSVPHTADTSVPHTADTSVPHAADTSVPHTADTSVPRREEKAVPRDHGARRLTLWFNSAALVFYLSPLLLLGIALLGARNIELYRDRVQERVEFQAVLEAGLPAERARALAAEMAADGEVWREARAVSPSEHFKNIQGMDDWINDPENSAVAAALSHSLRLKPREPLRRVERALQAADALRGRPEVREVFTGENALKRLYLNFEFWKNSAVALEWAAGGMAVLTTWLLRKLKLLLLMQFPLERHTRRARRVLVLRFFLGVKKSLFFGAAPLIFLLAVHVALDYTAAPVFHYFSNPDPMFPIQFISREQSCFLWLFGAALWWTLSTPLAYRAAKD